MRGGFVPWLHNFSSLIDPLDTPEPRLPWPPLPLPPVLLDRLEEQRVERRGLGLFRQRKLAQGLEPLTGPSLLNLRGNDYLCLARDPAVLEGAHKALEVYGASASASPLVSGYLPLHQELESTVAAWHGFSHAMLMVSGFAANRSVLSQLPRPGDLVLADRLVHNSILSGIMASGAKIHRFPHNDLDHVQGWLEDRASGYGQVFVVTETVFSMDGDGPDLRRLVELRKNNPFVLVLDEAHAVGWHGPNGAGMLEEVGCLGMADIVVSTLGKALGSQGAYVLAHDERILDHLINFAGEYIYSTFLSPPAAGAALAAHKRILQLADERPRWQAMAMHWRESLEFQGWSQSRGHSPILTIPIADPDQTIAVTRELEKQGILVSGIRPPTVPPGTSRLRISIHRNIRETDLDRLIKALEVLL